MTCQSCHGSGMRDPRHSDQFCAACDGDGSIDVVGLDRMAWIDQNADKARLVASGWWPAHGDEGRDDDRGEPMGGEG